jgi:hypothetical protein
MKGGKTDKIIFLSLLRVITRNSKKEEISMLFVMIALAFVFLAGVAFIVHLVFDKKVSGYEGAWGGCAVVFVFIAALCLFFLVLGTAIEFDGQKNDYYDLKKIDGLEAMFKDKAEALTTQFASYLAVSYPQHEKEIFAQISPEKIGVYAAAYPAIKSSETMMALVGEISKLQADRYQQKADRIQKLRDIEYRKHSPWTINAWIRKCRTPDEEK